MSFFSTDNLRAVTGGRWLQRVCGEAILTGVGIDTRVDLTGRAFVAIRGDRHDGHDHLEAAAAAGAVVLVVDRAPPAGSCPVDVGMLLVSDTRRALARFALTYRRSLVATKVIAVTGSAGKTTTKNLIHAVLSTKFTGTAAPRSYNNDIGVPLTILAARPHDTYLVVEIGSGAPGEIARLARLVEPDLAVITSIGHAHLGSFGTVEAIAREKAALLAHLARDGTAFLNADAPALARYARGLRSVVRFGAAGDADLRLTARGGAAAATGEREAGWWFEINGRMRFDLALPGRHNAINALAAVGIGRRFGLDDEALSVALATVEAEPMRMTVAGVGGVRVYNDAYNANPDSMVAALETFIEAAADAPRRIVLLGDMLELGEREAELHRALGEHVVDVDTRCPIEHAFLVGPRCVHAAAALLRVWPSTRVTRLDQIDDAAAATVARHLRPGDALLVKASRGIGLDRLVETLVTCAAATPEIEVKPAASRAPRPGRSPTAAS